MEEDFDWGLPEEKEEDIHICEKEDCSHKGFACRLPNMDYDEATKTFGEDHIEYLCCKHAEEAGYCMGCGEFIAGTGMEFTNNGYCDNCYDEIRSTSGEDDDEDEEWYDPNFDEDFDQQEEDNNPNDSRNL